jgi:solute carrier family 13 (sodium-dependent dicarboxylate transporter), member 2/3/5
MTVRVFGLFLGLALFLLLVAIPTLDPFVALAGMGDAAKTGVPPDVLASSTQTVLGLLLLMVVWWITEAVPLPVTALMPAVLLPIGRVTGAVAHGSYEFTLRNVLGNYASPVIYLFVGGFLLAAAMQKWGLERRLTLMILTRGRLADSPRGILLAVMGVTAFLSMWISNTATAAMMLPLGLGILRSMDLRPGTSSFGTAMMLGIAWSASIGGIGTIIGTPPNGIALGILNATLHGDAAAHITFLDWMAFGVPLAVILVPIAWGILLWRCPPEIAAIPGGRDGMVRERDKLGPWNSGEKATVGVFLSAVVLWVSNPFWPDILPATIAAHLGWVDEYAIGLIVGLLPFFIPLNLKRGQFLLDWGDARFIEWGTLLLFGGGIALSDAMFKTGVATWVAQSFIGVLGEPSTLVMTFAVVFFIAMLTEVTSNTAVTGMFVPVVISIAVRSGEDPVTLVVASAIAASLAFMLPVATPPNALVYGTGYIRMKDMVRNGFLLDLAGWLVTVAVLYVLAHQIFGVLRF